MKIFLFTALMFSINITLSSQITMDSVICYLPFNSNSIDESGNDNHAIVSDAILTDDRFGNPNSAYFLDGQSSYMKICNSNLELSYNSTISFWFAPASNLDDSSQPQIFMHSDFAGDTNGHFLIAFNRINCLQFPATSDGKINFEVQGDLVNANSTDCPGFGLTSTSSSTTNWNSDEWNMVTVVVENGELKIYVNSVLENTNPSVSGLFTSGKDVYIGGYITFMQQEQSLYHGKIDDILIYNKALSVNEIEDLYNAITLSTNTLNLEHNISAYPNPFDSYIITNIENYSEPYTIQVINSLGLVLQSHYTLENNYMLLNDLEKGIYFILFKSENGTILSCKKMIK